MLKAKPIPIRVLIASLPAIVGFGPIACERTTRDTDIRFFSVSESKVYFDRVARGDSKAALFVDPRPAKAYAASHIPGSRNLTLPQVKVKSKPDPHLNDYEMLIVYGDDPASATARGMTKRLLEVGYANVRFFAGGLEDWNNRNYPLDKAPPTPGPMLEPAEPRKEPSAPEAK
jgi:rhodanese-related sulfurtransferase